MLIGVVLGVLDPCYLPLVLVIFVTFLCSMHGDSFKLAMCFLIHLKFSEFVFPLHAA